MKRDPLTKEEFLPKSISQRFATPENRIKFHNLNAKLLRHSSAYINKPQHVNLRILNELMKGKKEDEFHKQFLLGKGFSFKVHNHFNVHDGKNHYALYQYTIVVLGNNQIKIIKND